MAYVEYETYEHVAEAVKMMDGGKNNWVRLKGAKYAK